MHFMDSVYLLTIEKDTFGQGCLARIDVGGNAYVPHLVNVVGHLEPSPHFTWSDERRTSLVAALPIKPAAS
jgi:hypothetical protein